MATIGHNHPTVTINSLSAEDRKKLRGAINELNDSMTRVAAERDLQKQTINDLFDQLGVDKKVVRRMAKAYYRANYNSEVEDNRNFEEFYDTTMKELP